MAKHGDLSKVSKKSGTGKHAVAQMESVAKKVLIAVLVVLVLACIGLFVIIFNTPSTKTTTTSLSALNDLASGPNIKVTSGAADGVSDNTSAGEVKKYDGNSGDGLIDYRIQVQYKSDDANDTSDLMTITDTLPEYTEASMIDGGYVVAESTDGTTTILGTPAYNPTTREVTFQVKNLSASTDSKQVVYTYKIQAKVTEDADSLNADTINYKNVATLKSGSQTIESNKVNYTSGNSGNADNKGDESSVSEPKQDEETSTIQYKGTYAWNYLETTDDGVTANTPDALVVNAGESAEISAYPRVDEGGNAPTSNASDPYSSLYEKYVFMGWELSSGSTAQLENGTVSNISGNFELIGTWKKREYTLSFATSDGEDASTLGLNTMTYKWGDEVSLPSIDESKLASLNKRFTGWSFTPDINSSSDSTFVMPTENVLATANLKQTFTVDAKFGDVFAADGTHEFSEGIEGDEVVIKPKEFEGITFKEWSFEGGNPSNLRLEDDGSARFTIADKNITCKAVYTIEITFEVQNGTMYEPGEDYDGKKVKKITVEVEADENNNIEHPTWTYKLAEGDIPTVARNDSTYNTSVIRPDSSSTFDGCSWESLDAINNIWGEPREGLEAGIKWDANDNKYVSENTRFVFAYKLLPTGNFTFKVNDDDFGYLTVSDSRFTENDQFGNVQPYTIEGVNLTDDWVKDSAGKSIELTAHNKPGYKFVGWQLEGKDDLLADANKANLWHPEKVAYLNGTSAAFIPGVYVAVFERNFDEVTTDSIKLSANDIYISIDEAANLTDSSSSAVSSKLIELAEARAEHMAEPHDAIAFANVDANISADRGVYDVTFASDTAYSVTDAGRKMQESVTVKAYVRSASDVSQTRSSRITANDFVLSVDEAEAIVEGKTPGSGFNLFKAFADENLNDGEKYLGSLASVNVSNDELRACKLDYSGKGSGDYSATFETACGLKLSVKAQVCDNVSVDNSRNVRIGANSAHISVEDADLLLDKDTRTASTLTALLKPVAYNTETGAYVQIDEVSQNIAASDGSFNVEFSTPEKSSVKCTFDVGEQTVFSRIASLGGIMFALVGVLALLALGSAGVLIYARRAQAEYIDDYEE